MAHSKAEALGQGAVLPGHRRAPSGVGYDIDELEEGSSLSQRERVAYGCGDTACNVVFGMVNTLLTLFYTDYIGIPVVTVGTVLLVSRVLDGICAMLVGIISAKTNSRWGKTRPWILFSTIPYCITAVSLFTVPQTDASIQFWYIFVTYNLCATIFYNAINVPYGTLSTLMTRSSGERDMLSVFRSAMSPLGRIIAVTLTMPVVKLLGDTQTAWVIAMSIWSAVAFIMLAVCFFNCKETVEIPAAATQRVSAAESAKALVTNKYFWAALILWSVTCVHTTLVGTSLPYYCKYLFHNDGWMYSALYFAEMAILILGALCCPKLLKRFNKRDISLYGCVVAIAAHAVLLFDPGSFTLAMVCVIVRTLGQAPLTALIFGMIGDSIEYGQWKSHIRQESVIYGGCTFGFKVGTGICSAVISQLMAASGYVSATAGSAVQPDSALLCIQNIYLYGPLIIWAVAAAVLLLYNLDDIYPEIMRDLKEREARGEM